MDGATLIKGMILGFSIAAPVGPIGVLCIRRTLASGRLAGLVSGLGAATADALYGALAVSGLTLVANMLMTYSGWLRWVGGLFLCYLGLKTALSPPASEPARTSAAGLGQAYLSTLGLTLSNPLTILSFVAIFASFGGVEGPGMAGLLVGGVFIGSALWWLILSGGVGLFRSLVGGRGLRIINIISGCVLVKFGLITLGS